MPEQQVQSARVWLPVEPQAGGQIGLKGGRAIRVLEVGSLHLRLRSPAERRRIFRAEEELYNGLRFPVQRIALPVPLDLTAFEEEVVRQVESDPNRDRALMLLDKVNHVRDLITERRLVQWRNLLIIPGPPPGSAGTELPLPERVQQVRSGLEQCGLPVRELDGDETRQVWLSLLCPHVQSPSDGQDPLDGILPPEGFWFGPQDWFQVGPQVCRVIAVTGYPRHVTPAHFADLYRMDHQVVVVQHLHPTDSAELQREISHSIGEMNARLAGTMAEHDREATKARLRDAQRLLRKLAGENHSVLDFCMYLWLRATDTAELEALTRRVQGRLRSKGMHGRALRLTRQAPGFIGCLPVGLNLLREVTRRNLPAASVPATFPYANAEMTHGRGFVMGLNKDTGNLVLVDPWELMNAHSVFIGTAGAGKTFTLNELLTQFWSWGIQIRSIDIEGDKGRLCQALDGQRVRLAPYAGNCINPMEVRRPALDPSLFLDAEAEEPANGLAATIQRQLILFSLMLPDVTPVELARAESLLIGCYAEHDIHFGTDFARLGPGGWPTP